MAFVLQLKSKKFIQKIKNETVNYGKISFGILKTKGVSRNFLKLQTLQLRNQRLMKLYGKYILLNQEKQVDIRGGKSILNQLEKKRE